MGGWFWFTSWAPAAGSYTSRMDKPGSRVVAIKNWEVFVLERCLFWELERFLDDQVELQGCKEIVFLNGVDNSIFTSLIHGLFFCLFVCQILQPASLSWSDWFLIHIYKYIYIYIYIGKNRTRTHIYIYIYKYEYELRPRDSGIILYTCISYIYIMIAYRTTNSSLWYLTMITLSPIIMVQWKKYLLNVSGNDHILEESTLFPRTVTMELWEERVPWINCSCVSSAITNYPSIAAPKHLLVTKKKVAESKRPPPRTASPYDASQRMARGGENKNHGQEGMTRKLRWRWLENPPFLAGDMLEIHLQMHCVAICLTKKVN